ncbi:hypothetical protein [Allosphingosinicella sp.]|uniref:hypothetical protein n=1 Tax=Allosphingosinicella sp. TaxID=2823234 RepID=UPI003784A9DE
MAKKPESAKKAPIPKKAAAEKPQPDLPLEPQAEPAPEKVPDPDWYIGEDEPAPVDDRPLTTSDFHGIAQKQILNAVFAVLSDAKMGWETVEPFLAAARDVVLGDIEETAQVRLHTVQQDEQGGWVEAEEAYLGISVSDRDTGEEWLSDTWWLSELAIAEDDPEQVRAIIRALERTSAKLNKWLADKGALPVTPAA